MSKPKFLPMQEVAQRILATPLDPNDTQWFMCGPFRFRVTGPRNSTMKDALERAADLLKFGKDDHA